MTDMSPPIQFWLNSALQTYSGRADETLLNYLRQSGRVGSKEGCASGDCGACTVLVQTEDEHAYKAMNACILPVQQLNGQAVITVEGLPNNDELHPAQLAMIATHGAQCGFCTPGFVMALAGWMDEQAFSAGLDGDGPPKLNSKQAETMRLKACREAISGNLCRCTGYRPILQAAKHLANSQGAALFETHKRLDKVLFDSPPDHSGPYNTGFREPQTLGDLKGLLRQQPSANLIAGGTDLMLEVTQKQGRFDQLISLARVLELQRLEINADGAIIGSAVTYQDLQAAAELRWPALHHFLSRLGSPQIRNRGTIGGNLGTASPIGDLLPILLAMDATIVMSHFEEADRKVPISEFLQGYRKTQLQPGNVIKEVEVTGLQDFLRYYKISKRQEDDIAAVSVAVRLKLDADHITLARIAFGGVAEQALRLPALEQALQGQTITETLMTALHQQVLLALNPISDVRASRGYRREMAANLLVRALKEARGLPMPQIYGLDDA